jgi:hypothetical protein
MGKRITSKKLEPVEQETLHSFESLRIFMHVRQLPCAACGKGPSDAAHIRSRGAGGPDDFFNLMPLCRKHHIEQHTIGIRTFVDKHDNVKKHLQHKGWEIGEKLWHKELSEV